MPVENCQNEPWLDYDDAVEKGIFHKKPSFDLGQSFVQVYMRVFAEAPEDSQCHIYTHERWGSMLREDVHKFIKFRPVNPHLYKYLKGVKIYEPKPFEAEWIKHNENI
jgi:hypothetical protein